MKIVFVFLTLCLLWGLSYPIAKIGLQHATPLLYASVAGGFALIVHLGIALRLGGRHPSDRRFHQTALIMGFFNVGALHGLLNIGVARVSAGESSMLLYTQPIFVGLLAWLILGERPTWLKTIGLVAGFGGMVIVLSDRIRPGQESPAWAYAALLAGSLAWSLGTIYFKRVHGSFDFLWLNFYQSLYGILPLAAAALLIENPSRIDWGLTLWLSIFFWGALAMGLGRLLWFYLLRRQQASVLSAYVFLSPLVAVISGILILHERVNSGLILGGAMILAGIYLVNRDAKAGQPVPATKSAPASPLRRSTVAPGTD